MQAARAMAPRHLPGTSASRALMALAVVYSASTLVLLAFLSLVNTPWLAFLTGPNTIWTPRHWHLPWPVLQWAVDSPTGYLALSALGILVVAPLFVWFGLWWYRRKVVSARDVTYVPQVGWVSPWQARLQPPLLQRWLGLRRRERALSLGLVAVGMLLAVALVVVFFAAVGVAGRFAVTDAHLCTVHEGCPPLPAPLKGIGIVSWNAAMALVYGARWLWLHRLEVTSGVWFRYGGGMGMTTLSYVRQPGVTPEAATAALARVSSARVVPSARYLFFGALVYIPWMVLWAAAWLLDTWLQYQWLPG
jgi:hypothetical protein